jgi:hypothetical protein
VALWLVPLRLAVIATVVTTAGVPVVTVKVALVLPPATVTLAGTAARVELLLASDTAMPDPGAGPLSVTVPCVALPPFTITGFSVTELTPVGVTVIVTVAMFDVTPAAIAS